MKAAEATCEVEGSSECNQETIDVSFVKYLCEKLRSDDYGTVEKHIDIGQNFLCSHGYFRSSSEKQEEDTVKKQKSGILSIFSSIPRFLMFNKQSRPSSEKQEENSATQSTGKGVDVCGHNNDTVHSVVTKSQDRSKGQSSASQSSGASGTVNLSDESINLLRLLYNEVDAAEKWKRDWLQSKSSEQQSLTFNPPPPRNRQEVRLQNSDGSFDVCG